MSPCAFEFWSTVAKGVNVSWQTFCFCWSRELLRTYFLHKYIWPSSEYHDLPSPIVQQLQLENVSRCSTDGNKAVSDAGTRAVALGLWLGWNLQGKTAWAQWAEARFFWSTTLLETLNSWKTKENIWFIQWLWLAQWCYTLKDYPDR